METTDVINGPDGQIVKLPEGFHFSVPSVSIRKEGAAVILEPVRAATWPVGFFEAIHIADPAFGRPSQGATPPAPQLG